MKTLKSVLILSSVALFIFGFTTSDETIKGWFKAGSLPESYKTGLDKAIFQKGQKSVFIVEKDGSVTNGKVVKGVDPLINDEALKAVMSSPKWTPGKQRGTAVRVSYIIMLNFQL
jgi:hypothetical protein